jgi:hypothetical protein
VAIKDLILLGASTTVQNSSHLTPIDIVLRHNDKPFEDVALKLMARDGEALRAMNPAKVSAMLEGRTRQQRKKDVGLEEASYDQCDREATNIVIRLREKMLARGLTLEYIFATMDLNNDGVLNYAEFEGLILWLGIGVRA